jgi:predicted nucleic acid-binding protein
LSGTNEMWIAATALVNDQPLVTRNADEFRRVAGLEVLSY